MGAQAQHLDSESYAAVPRGATQELQGRAEERDKRKGEGKGKGRGRGRGRGRASQRER